MRSEMRSSARGRMCVTKIVAEAGRYVPRDECQGGLRCNAIAFLQATAHVHGSNELPSPKDAAVAFMPDTPIVALAGADVGDSHKAKWTDVRGTSCVDCAELSTRDDHFYHGSVIANPHRASTDLQESGSATEAVLQRVVSIQVARHLPR